MGVWIWRMNDKDEQVCCLKFIHTFGVKSSTKTFRKHLQAHGYLLKKDRYQFLGINGTLKQYGALH